MDVRSRMVPLHLPVTGHPFEQFSCGNLTYRMARPIAKAYSAMQSVDESQKSIWCRQLHHQLLNQTPESILCVGPTPHIIRSELRFKVGLRCYVDSADGIKDALVTNISGHGVLLNTEHFRLNNTFSVRINTLEQSFRIKNPLHYRLVKQRGSFVHAEKLAIQTDANEALDAFLRNIRWCNQLDQRDIFLWFIQEIMQEIRSQLACPGKPQVAFYTLRAEPTVYTTHPVLPVIHPFCDGFISLRTTEKLQKQLSLLKRFSPHLYQQGQAMLQSRLRYILW